MDNKKQPVNPMAQALDKVMKYSNSFVQSARKEIEEKRKTLSPEERKKVDEALKQNGIEEKLSNLESTLKGVRETINKATNGQPHKAD